MSYQVFMCHFDGQILNQSYLPSVSRITWSRRCVWSDLLKSLSVCTSPDQHKHNKCYYCYVPICDAELLFEYFSVCSFSGFSCPFALFYFHCRRWRADWPSRLSIIRDELIGCDDVRGGVFNHACWLMSSRAIKGKRQCIRAWSLWTCAVSSILCSFDCFTL